VAAEEHCERKDRIRDCQSKLAHFSAGRSCHALLPIMPRQRAIDIFRTYVCDYVHIFFNRRKPGHQSVGPGISFSCRSGFRSILAIRDVRVCR
jgi:hypothetical protein